MPYTTDYIEETNTEKTARRDRYNRRKTKHARDRRHVADDQQGSASAYSVQYQPMESFHAYAVAERR